MCGPEDPLFTPLLPLTRVPFQAKESVHKIPFWENLETLASTASIFTQIWKFSAHKPPFSEANVSSQAPHFENLGRTSLPEKMLSAPPPGAGTLVLPDIHQILHTRLRARRNAPYNSALCVNAVIIKQQQNEPPSCGYFDLYKVYTDDLYSQNTVVFLLSTKLTASTSWDCVQTLELTGNPDHCFIISNWQPSQVGNISST